MTFCLCIFASFTSQCFPFFPYCVIACPSLFLIFHCVFQSHPLRWSVCLFFGLLDLCLIKSSPLDVHLSLCLHLGLLLNHTALSHFRQTLPHLMCCSNAPYERKSLYCKHCITLTDVVYHLWQFIAIGNHSDIYQVSAVHPAFTFIFTYFHSSVSV